MMPGLLQAGKHPVCLACRGPQSYCVVKAVRIVQATAAPAEKYAHDNTI